MLMGVFRVSILHNIVHMLFGVGCIAKARSHGAAKNDLSWDRVIFLVLWIDGLVIDHESDANFVPVNDADNGLLLIGRIGMVALALLLTSDRGRDRGTCGTGHAYPAKSL